MKLYTEWADADGKNGIIKPAHSWLLQSALFWSAFMGDNHEVTGVPDTKDTGGTLRTVNKGSDYSAGSGNPIMLAEAAASVTTYGLLVGTGTTAVTKEDNAMETLIADGASASQLEYGITVISHAYGISGGYRVTVSRLLQNDSGGDITVRECGLAIKSTDSGLTDRFFLWIHDLQTQLISDTEGKVFKYHMDFLI